MSHEAEHCRLRKVAAINCRTEDHSVNAKETLAFICFFLLG
jgi:hypothetical protein